MKKNMCSIFASILCSATLLLGIAGCDTGAGEDDPVKGYNEEIPTTAKTLGADVFDGSVWDFSAFQKDGGTCGTTEIKSDDIERKGEITPSSKGGKGTSLEFTNFKGKGNASPVLNSGYLQSSKSSTANLTNLAGYQLTLTLGTASNIYIKAAGAGAAEAARYLAIADSTDYVLISKENLGSQKTVDFQIQGAPAGAYKIYLNGAAIVKIDLSSAHKFALPPQINKLVLYKGDEVADKNLDPIEASIDTVKLGAWNVISDTNKVDLTEEAVWTSSNESVATVKAGTVTGVSAGKAIIRARIGRFYDERTVTVTPCTKTLATFFKSTNNPEAENLKLGVDWSDNETAENAVKKMVKPDLVGDIAVISDETFAFSDTAKTMDWEGKESPVIAKAASATGEGDYKTGVIYWKNEQSNAWTDDQHFATLSFYATPKDGKVNLKSITFKTPTSNSNAKHYAVSVKVGDNEETPLKLCEKGPIDIDVNNTISSRTKVEVKLYVLKKGSNLNSGSSGKAKSFGFNEIIAVFSDISDK